MKITRWLFVSESGIVQEGTPVMACRSHHRSAYHSGFRSFLIGDGAVLRKQAKREAVFRLPSDCRKTHTYQHEPHILHLRCSLCSQESAAAQGLWALFRNLNRRVAYYRSLHSFRLTTAGRFALRASAHWAHTSLRLHTRQETAFPAPSPFLTT